MKITKTINPAKCSAQRCQEKPTHTVAGECWDRDGERIPVCPRHFEAAEEAFEISSFPGAGRVIGEDPDFDAAPPEPEIVPGATTKEIHTPDPQAMALETREAKDSLDLAREMVIETQEDLEFAAEILAGAKGKARELKSRLDKITKPLNAALKEARDLFRPALEYYGTIEVELKKRIEEVTLRQQEESRAAMLKAAEAHEEGDTAGATEALSQVKTVGSVQGLSTRQTWDFVIVDASQIPREFLIPNEKAIRAHARAAKNEAPNPIPGVKFVPRVIVASRSA